MAIVESPVSVSTGLPSRVHEDSYRTAFNAANAEPLPFDRSDRIPAMYGKVIVGL